MPEHMPQPEAGVRAAPSRRTAGAPTQRPVPTWLLGGLFALALAWTLRATVSVTLPLAVALFIALCVWPITRWVQARVPSKLRWLGVVAALLVVVALLAGFVGGLALAIQQIADVLPRFAERARGAAQQAGGGLLGSEQVTRWVGTALEEVGRFGIGVLRTATATVSGVVIVLFLVLLMLTEARTWRGKLSALEGARERGWDEAFAVAGDRFRRFFLTRLVLGSITGLLYVAWLALWGVDLLLVWGLLALLLNFVPIVGSLIAGLLPVGYVLATMDPTSALVVGAGILVIEQVMGNYVDPRLLGRRLAISPLVILAALLLWTWIWGPGGALMAVPMTVLLVILFAHLPALRPVALLLSDETDMRGLDEKTSMSGEAGEKD